MLYVVLFSNTKQNKERFYFASFFRRYKTQIMYFCVLKLDSNVTSTLY